MWKKLCVCIALGLCLPGCVDSAPPAVSEEAGRVTSTIEATGAAAERPVDIATDQARGRDDFSRSAASKRKSTADLVTSGGVNTIRAYAVLDASDFEETISKVAAEGADVPSAVEATFVLQKSLAGLASAIDPEARIGRVACNGEVCVASVQSSMGRAQWEAWKGEFARTEFPNRSATIYSTLRLQDGSTAYRMLLITKPGSNGVNIPFRSIPTADPRGQQGHLSPRN